MRQPLAHTIALMTLLSLFALPIHSEVHAGTGDWPTYRAANDRSGYIPDDLAPSLEAAWVYRAPAAPSLAWPTPGRKIIEGLEQRHRMRFDDVINVVAADGKLYFGSSVDNSLYCMDLNTGQELWRFITDAPVRLAPTIDQGRVFFGSDDGFVYCLDAQSGKVIWQLRAGPGDERILARGRIASRWAVRTGVLVEDGIAYFGAGIFPHERVYLYAVDAATGKLHWRNDTINEQDAARGDLTPQGYLLASDDTLFVPSGRSMPAAMDRATGQFRHKPKPSWRGDGGGQVGGTEAILADGQMYSLGEHHVLAIDQDSGKTGFGWFQGRAMTLAGDMGYMADGKTLTAIDRVAFATAQQRRKVLSAELSRTRKSLNNHRSVEDQKKVTELETQLKSAADDTERAHLSKVLTEAQSALEESKAEYQSLLDQLSEASAELASLEGAGVNWVVESPHESTMIAAGNAIVIGGDSQVVVHDRETGKPRWSAKVQGEARGLAIADGRLIVSTTEGHIYCYADPSDQSPPTTTTATASEKNPDTTSSPYPADAWSDRYAKAAQQIIDQSNIKRGFCLVVGSEDGRLAYEIAKRSDLMVYGVESDAQKVAASREKLAATGLYGSRVTIDHFDITAIPYPSYFANLIVSDTLLRTGKLPGIAADATEIARLLKPIGGVMMLSHADASAIRQWVGATELEDEDTTLTHTDGWVMAIRAALPGAGAWSHQYGNVGNTASTDEYRVRGGLRVLWYGDPGPSKVLNRHVGAVAPLSVNGRLYVQGDESIMAYDAYNGLFLWERENPGAMRTGVWNNYESGNLAADDDSLFMAVYDTCYQIDGQTGAIVHEYKVPARTDGLEPAWGYIAVHEGRLFGTSSVRELIPEEKQRRGRAAQNVATDQVFAYDTKNRELLWTYQGKSVSHTTIAIGDNRVYFVDSAITPDQRRQLLDQDKTELAKLTGEAKDIAEARIKRLDARVATALDAATGKQLWANPVDVTDCTGVGIGAGQLTLMFNEGYVLLCGANANGHYWGQFLSGDFERRRLVVLEAETGEKLWAKDANYRHRPIVIGTDIIAEPWSFDLCTGEQRTRTHPITGEATPWMFARPGHHCGGLSATPNMLFFRSGFTAFYDLENDSGTRHFAGHRLGCWINTIPANGLVMIPEASAGCVCLFSLASTVVFEPAKTEHQTWGVYAAHGPSTPVRHMAVNLGAPGDRRDHTGKLWLGYPRPWNREGINIQLDIEHELRDGGAFFYHDAAEVDSSADGQIPWVIASGVNKLQRISIPLVAEGETARRYTVRLTFAGAASEASLPDIVLQGKPVKGHETASPTQSTATSSRTIKFSNVSVAGQLTIDLNAKPSAATLCGIEVLVEGGEPVLH